MAGSGGGGGVPVSPGAGMPSGGARRGGNRQKAAWLPLDIIISEIAARSDPATLVRCAATCRDARRRVAEIADDPDLRGRLRLRGTDRFVLPLLRGHMTGVWTHSGGFDNTDLYMVDTSAAADATRVVKVKTTFADEAAAGETTTEVTRKREVVPLDSRGGLLLVRVTTTAAQDHTLQQQLLVCNLGAARPRRWQALPPSPAFHDDTQYYPDDAWSMGVQYVLLVGNNENNGGGDAGVGRPFQVIKVKLVMSYYRSYRRLLFHTYSSEHGAWSSQCTELPTPNLNVVGGWWSSVLLGRPLVLDGGDAVHWLCLTDVGSYMLILHVAAARVNLTVLPASFPRDDKNPNDSLVYDDRLQYLLATATAGGNPIVLIADKDNISAWEQSRHTKMWKPRPQVVIEKKTILAFKDDGLAELLRVRRNRVPEMLWFGERSGAVLLRVHGCLLWLDLQSNKIVRCFSSDRRMQYAKVYCPYEMHLSSWVPTFSSSAVVTTV